jgi:hypothetical protein
MSLLLMLVSVPLTPIFDRIPRAEQQPPKAYAEGVRLPGKPPPALKDLQGAWQLGYELADAQLSDGNAELIVNMVLQLDADGTYHLSYAARWGNPPLRGKDAKGITVDESGTFKLSGDVLLLDPAETMLAELERNKVVRREPTRSEKHVYVVHWESKRIHIAGRCARYQVDPICQDPDVQNVWYTLKGSVGRRLFGR